MCVHLAVNATVLDGAATFQDKVFSIHSLGKLLPIVEWVFIFLPILFHGILGVLIIRGAVPNSGTYTYGSNVRYTLQRVSGMIAFVFILWHVFHMHGWYHGEAWMKSIDKLAGGQFRPYNATSTAGAAMQASFIVPVLYAIGILASVFHLANGIWTMGITWGVWISPAAQQRASWACAAFGVILAGVGLGAVGGLRAVDVEAAKKVEDRMYEARVEMGALSENEEKRSHSVAAESEEATKSARRILPSETPTQRK
jgi:succinate dehydrogenase / fumarate reductase cytochrome b subunit